MQCNNCLSSLLFILTITITLIFNSSIYATPPGQATCKVNRAAGFCLQNIINGKTVTLDDYSEKAIFILFGSLYCKPCREMFPVLNELYKKHQSSGLKVIAIDIDNPPDEKALKKFALDMNIDFPFLIGTKKLAKKYGIVIVPTVFLINKKGSIVKRYLGLQTKKSLERDFCALE